MSCKAVVILVNDEGQKFKMELGAVSVESLTKKVANHLELVDKNSFYEEGKGNMR